MLRISGMLKIAQQAIDITINKKHFLQQQGSPGESSCLYTSYPQLIPQVSHRYSEVGSMHTNTHTTHNLATRHSPNACNGGTK